MEDKDFEALIDMFASDGWKYFVTSAKELERAVTDGAVDSAVTNDQWQYCRGQTHQLRSILGYENFIRSTLEQQEQDALVVEEEEVNVNII